MLYTYDYLGPQIQTGKGQSYLISVFSWVSSFLWRGLLAVVFFSGMVPARFPSVFRHASFYRRLGWANRRAQPLAVAALLPVGDFWRILLARMHRQAWAFVLVGSSSLRRHPSPPGVLQERHRLVFRSPCFTSPRLASRRHLLSPGCACSNILVY